MDNNSTFNFSYLCPREQSLRAGTHFEPKNLLYHFGETDKDGDIVKVYLRIKPSETDPGKLFRTVDDRKLFVDHSRESTSSNKSDHARRYSEQFIFTKILQEGISQSQVFTECALQPLKNFIQGDNCLMFAYGTTNAGKTFTIRGDAANPGIIPRALDFVFSSLGDRVLDEPSLILVNGSHLEQLSDSETALLLDYKRIMLEGGIDRHKLYDRKWTSTMSVNSDASSDATEMFHNVEGKMRHDLPTNWNISVSGDGACYLIYVSFAEIYNESVYDLLQLTNPQQVHSWRRTPLQLGLDANGNTYIKDLQHFQVTSGYEAYRIMLFGQHNLRIASTVLNTVSSRSHCIFNIKLVKCAEDMNLTRISTFSFCDLAGSERAKKTHNCGERMKESQNINTSLLVLGRCLNTIRSNQQMKEKLLVPFRDSKLTRLFKEPLLGKGNVCIIVNINMDPYLYDETVNVLKFSAIAREVVLPQRRKKKPPPRMSLFAHHLKKRRQTLRNSSMEGSSYSYDANDVSSTNTASLVKLVAQLQMELRQERSNAAALVQQLRAKEQECAAKDRSYSMREDNLRTELVREFQDSLKEMVSLSETTRESMEYRLEDMANFRVRVTQKKYEDKLKRLKRQMKKRKYEDVEDIEEEEDDEHRDVEERLRSCKDQLAASIQEVQSVTAERNALRATVASQSQVTRALQERVSRLELHLKVASTSTLQGGCSAHDDMVSDLKLRLGNCIEQNASLEEKVKLLTATVDSAAEDHEELLEEKNKLEKDCYCLEKRLAEKEMEVAEFMSKVETYQATFSKQVRQLDLLQRVGHDRLEALEQKENLVRDLELRIKELSLSQQTHSRGKLSDKNVAPGESCAAQPGTLPGDVELLQNIQASGERLTEKEELNNPLVRICKTEDTPTLKHKDVAVLTEQTGEQSLVCHCEMSSEYTLMKEQLHELQTENASLREVLAKQKQEVAELLSSVAACEANFCKQSKDMELLQKVANDRLEALQQKAKVTTDLELRVEELSSSEEKGQHLTQQLTDQNSALVARLASVEHRLPEVEILQKEIKRLLQQICTLETSAKEKDAELQKLQQDLKAEITTGIKYKEDVEKHKRIYNHDMAVEKAVMKGQIEQLNVENFELRNSLLQLEKEMDKQKLQHESLFKVYDDRLKQKTEEIERHKRDAQHCQELLYKNTPTPNKEVKELIMGLQDTVRKKDDQLSNLRVKMERLKVHTVDNTMLTEDHPADVREISPLSDHFEENRQPTKSTTKKGQTLRSKTPSKRVQHTKESASTDSKVVLQPKTKAKLKKQLFTLHNDSFVNIDNEDQWEPLHSKEKEGKRKPKSPNTLLKRSLRSKP